MTRPEIEMAAITFIVAGSETSMILEFCRAAFSRAWRC
jgi:hypothetical protein